MAGIFISYRREDSAGWTGRLAERLKQKFGTESIFMDIDTIQPGTDFAEVLRSAVGSCDVLLAMIGPTWRIATNSEGQPRLEDPNDWVRLELTAALSRSIPVIPILVGGTSLPKVAALPEDLKKLFQYQAHELTDKRWEFDSNQLIQVLEKVVRGAKPKRNIVQTILTSRSTWVALVVLGLLLALGSLQLLTHVSNTEDEISKKNEAEVSESSVATPPPESKSEEMPVSAAPTPAVTPSGNTPENQQATAAHQEAASTAIKPIASTEKSGSNRLPASTSPVAKGARSLPAGVEVKFWGGDLTFRFVSLQVEEQSSDNTLLTVTALIKNSSTSLYWNNAEFRLQIDNSLYAPMKVPSFSSLENNAETSGQYTFVVPKSARRVGLRITSYKEQTTIPIDLKSGMSRLDVQPSGIPRSLQRIARIDNIYKGEANYDFRATTLEPYNVESFILRLSVRATTNDSTFFHFSPDSFRLVFDDAPHEPIKAPNETISANASADGNILFIVPKSITQVMLRVKDGDNWRSVPIDLKAGKS